MKTPRVNNVLTLAALAVIVNGGVRLYAIRKGYAIEK